MNLLNLFFRLSIFTLYSYPPTWTVVKSNYILKMIDLVEYTITLTFNTASGLIPVQLCGFGCAFHRVRYIELRKWRRIEISEKEALLLLLDSSLQYSWTIRSVKIFVSTPPYLPFDMIHKFLLTVHLVTIFFVVISIFLFLSLFFWVDCQKSKMFVIQKVQKVTHTSFNLN